MAQQITELESFMPKERKNPIPPELSSEERKVIAKKAGETKRKNNAIISRFEKNLNYKLMTEGKINKIAEALVEAASNPKSRNFLGAVRLIFGVTGIECEANKENNSQTINGENVQIVFSKGVDEFAK